MIVGPFYPRSSSSAAISYDGGNVQTALDTLFDVQAQVLAELDSNYRIEVVANSSLPPVTVAPGVPTLYPLPSPTAAPATWRPELWTPVAGVIVGSNDLAGVYEVAVNLSFSDDSGAPQVWTWTLARGTNLATTPVIAERISAPVQISIGSEPDNVTLHASFDMPASGTAFELALFAAHAGGSSINVTIHAMGMTLAKIGELTQV